MGAQIFPEHAWMGGVQDREAAGAAFVRHGASKGDNSPPPIMAREHKMFVLQTVRDANNVADKICHFVRLPIRWLAALVVAALIGEDDTKTGLGERRDLIAPAVPKFRKPMQENCQRAKGRSRRNRMDCHIRQIKRKMLPLGDHEQSPYAVSRWLKILRYKRPEGLHRAKSLAGFAARV